MFVPNPLGALRPRAWLEAQVAYLEAQVAIFRPLAEAAPQEYPIYSLLRAQLVTARQALGEGA